MMIDRFDRALLKIEIAMAHFSWIACLVVTFMIVIDITLRFIFNKPLPASWEISEICMPWIVFLPFAYTLTIDGHVRVSLVKDLLPAKWKLVFDVVSNAVSFVVCALFTYWSWLRFWESFLMNEEILAAIRLPWWIGKIAMPIGFGMFTLRYLMQFLWPLLFHDVHRIRHVYAEMPSADRF
jgi:TRAP-type C4-dicarboxylate transport system permease small subunit